MSILQRYINPLPDTLFIKKKIFLSIQGNFNYTKSRLDTIDDNLNWVTIIVNATQTPIERPKETIRAVRTSNTP
ncbi:hypothetical protein [Psychrobacter alimentarius]|uniref:hypothetical protein n=1 Tax=Psychrobacter alimentarius TaxID=261164 RepID=UPI003FD5608D